MISMVVALFLILSQVSEGFAGQSTMAPSQTANPPKLNITIIEGDGAINNVKQRVAREVIVQVNDENDRPVGGVALAFLLPTSGPGGVFSSGANVLNVTTNAAGRATAQFVPNSVSGTFQISVSASFQGQVSSIVIPQTNALSAAAIAASEAPASIGTGSGISLTTIAFIAAAVAGAVAVGVVATGKKGDKPVSVPGPPTIRIGGVGTPTVGTPGFQQSGRAATPIPQWR
jgi:hypothetical protein